MSQKESQIEKTEKDSDSNLINDIYEKINTLETRVETLEEENKELRSKNDTLESENKTLKKKVTNLEQSQKELKESVSVLEDGFEGIEWDINSLNNRANAINTAVEEAQSDITKQAFNSEEKRSDIKKRVTKIETELGLEDWEFTFSSAEDSCQLEKFASMPDEKRENELKSPVSRATLVWEHFDDWSSPTHKGRVIRSGELRKLLKANTGKKLAWTQIYRMMEEFDEKTTAEYQYIDNSSYGKALVRLRDRSDAIKEEDKRKKSETIITQ